MRRYGAITPEVKQRLEQEFGLIRKFNLAGFLLFITMLSSWDGKP